MSDGLFQALRQNDKHTFLQILKECLQNPPNLSNDDQKWTALYVTAVSKSQHKECLELLLEYGDGKFFNKDDRIWEGKTALHIACENGCDENVLVLLQRGCNADKKTQEEETALHIACSKGHLKIVEYLLNYAVNINERDKNGYTPLHLAVISNRVEMSRFLLKKAADTRLSDSSGCLPLHLAYFQPGYSTMARLLLEHDLTTINSQDQKGCTPLMHALHLDESDEHIHYLLENGARIEFCDKFCRTTLHYATKIKNKEILSLILQFVDTEWIEECLSNSNSSSDFPAINYFKSLISDTICSFDIEPLASLLTSRLPKSILQVPIITKDRFSLSPTIIHTPLTYSFDSFSISKEEEFNICLQLLLKHKITTMDEFNKIIQVKWRNYFKFSHPYSYLFSKSYFSSRLSHFLNVFEKNDISVDYCLQCYHDNTKPFTSYDSYLDHYAPVIEAVRSRNIEALKLMLSNSVILEPDKLLIDYLFSHSESPVAYNGDTNKFSVIIEYEKTYNIYQYLIGLKPLYYKQWRPKFERHFPFPTSGWGDTDTWKVLLREQIFSSFSPPKFGGTWKVIMDGLPSPNSWSGKIWKAILEELSSSFSINEQFSKVTLQQLCRTAIRHQLREPTLEANLRNFRRNILALPLPNLLKDYLLFKN